LIETALFTIEEVRALTEAELIIPQG